MAPPDPRETGLDPAHILRVCERAATGADKDPAVRYTLAAPVGVTVGLSTAKAARAASAALVRLGYQAAPARRSRWCREVFVAGWSPAGLESRLAALRLTIAQLRTGETATAAAVIGRYRRLSAQASGIEAGARAASQQKSKSAPWSLPAAASAPGATPPSCPPTPQTRCGCAPSGRWRNSLTP